MKRSIQAHYCWNNNRIFIMFGLTYQKVVCFEENFPKTGFSSRRVLEIESIESEREQDKEYYSAIEMMQQQILLQ